MNKIEKMEEINLNRIERTADKILFQIINEAFQKNNIGETPVEAGICCYQLFRFEEIQECRNRKCDPLNLRVVIQMEDTGVISPGRRYLIFYVSPKHRCKKLLIAHVKFSFKIGYFFEEEIRGVKIAGEYEIIKIKASANG